MGTPVKNLRVIVTGAARGIGFQLSRRLLSKGAKAVAILDLDPSAGAQAVKQLNELFGQGRSIFIQTDVSKTTYFEESFHKAVKQLGGLDILVNNAGIVNEQNWSLEIDINVKAVVQGTILAIETMGKHKGGKGGTVVNIGSTASLVSYKTLPVYCGTKSAVLGFTRCIALSYNQTGVAMKTICPGPIGTSLLLSGSDKFLSFHNQEKALNDQLLNPQTPESIAEQIVRVIEETPNGTIYLSVIETNKHLKGIVKIPEIDDLLMPF